MYEMKKLNQFLAASNFLKRRAYLNMQFRKAIKLSIKNVYDHSKRGNKLFVDAEKPPFSLAR